LCNDPLHKLHAITPPQKATPSRALPSELKGSLPRIEEIEAELSGDVGGEDE
jgi:hypothetical protein